MSFLRLIFSVICILVFSLAMAKKDQNTDFNVAHLENKILAVSGAELEISSVSVSKTVTWVIGLFNRTDLEQRKKNLVYELCREIGADILVDPQFTYSKTILGGGKLTVRGYPAKYKTFRSLSDEQIDSLLIHPKYDTNTIIFINED